MNHARSSQQSPTIHDRVRQTALELFSTYGYQSTSLRDLANHLGVQPGSIYNHI
ncbi:MAG: TetR/AcrR family transcriptional regulator [Pseudomonas sp.]